MIVSFTVPAYLIETEASGRRLIDYVRQILDAPLTEGITVGHVKLADWMMSDPVVLPKLVEQGGIAIDALLTDRARLTPEQGAYLFTMTGGAIRLADWLRPYPDVEGLAPREPSASAGAGAAETAPPAEPAPLPLSPDHPPIVQGRLGEMASGRLFRCVRGVGENRFLLTGMGVALALDRAAATAAYEALGQALGRDIER
ncbi:hypothetical protein HY78_14600 [Rhizorhabdus wittichii DC-6]|nr:hypothetical protein HY78_14600 [Rhizorhabdus wittichii DC-6]